VTSVAGSDNHSDYVLFVTIEYIFTSYSLLKLFITIVKGIRRQEAKGEDKLPEAVLSVGGRRGEGEVPPFRKPSLSLKLRGEQMHCADVLQRSTVVE